MNKIVVNLSTSSADYVLTCDSPSLETCVQSIAMIYPECKITKAEIIDLSPSKEEKIEFNKKIITDLLAKDGT